MIDRARPIAGEREEPPSGPAHPASSLGAHARLLLRKAAPMIFATQLQWALRLIAVGWIGRLIGAAGLAVASVMQPVEAVIWFLIGIVTRGSGVLVARAFGAGHDVAPIVRAGVGLVLTLSLGLFTLLALGQDLVVHLLVGDNVAIGTPAKAYLQTWLLNLPLGACTMILVGSVAATGRTHYGLVRTLIDLALTATLTPLFMRTLGLGIRGAPLTSACTAIVLLVLLATSWPIKRSGVVQVPAPRPFALWRSMVHIGAPLEGARIASWLVQTLYVGWLAREGTIVAAGYGLAFTLNYVLGMIGIAISSTTGIFIGHDLGRGRPVEARAILKAGLTVQLAVLLPLAILTWLFARPLLALLAKDPQLVAVALRTLAYLLASAPLWATWQLLIEVYSTARTAMLPSVAFVAIEAGIACAVLLAPGSKLDAICWGILANNSLRFLVTLVLFPRCFSRPLTLASAR